MFDYLKVWIDTNEKTENKIVDNFLSDFDIESNENYLYKNIIYKFCKNEQLKYWNKEIYYFIDNKIKKLENKLGKNKLLNVIVDNLDLLIKSYEKLLTIEERIILMEKFNGSEELKANIFSLNIYNDLLNSSYSSLLKLFIEIEGVVEEKNLFQKNLTSQIDVLTAREYEELTKLSDSDIRNSISHGDTYLNNNKITFRYKIGRGYLEKNKLTYDFVIDLKEVFDATAATCLRLFIYLIENMVTEEVILQNPNISEEGKNFIKNLSYSTILMECNYSYSFNPFGNKEKIQFNIDYTHPNLDIDSRCEFGLHVVNYVVKNENLKFTDDLYVGFKSAKSVNSFLSLSVKQLSEIFSYSEQRENALAELYRSSSMWEVNEEIRNETDDLFRNYGNIENERYKVSEITDISLDDKKRFSCTMYVGKVNKFQLKEIVYEAIMEVKTIKNYGFSNNKVKHGEMETDIVYMTIYKEEVRRGNKRSLFPENDNFICYVQYDINKKFQIKHDLIDKYLTPERIGYLQYRWNPNFNKKK